MIGYGKSGLCEPTSDQDQAPAGHYLTGVIVDPAWRRLGIGAELTRRRLAGIWSRGESAWFFTNTRNQASLELHAALGFVEIGRAASYLGEPFDGGSGVLLRADSGAPRWTIAADTTEWGHERSADHPCLPAWRH